MQLQFYNIINGERRPAASHHQVSDPRTEEPLWDAPIASEQDLEDAIEAAQKAYKQWSQSTREERVAVLQGLIDLIKDHAEELSGILMRETGKSSLLASLEIAAVIKETTYYTKVGLEDEVVFEDEHAKVVATHQPIGVVGAICPWNFPIILANIKVISSLVTGNCVIVKPSPFTPYAVLKWVELANEKKLLPPGVFQAVNGGADVGAMMSTHPGIAKITFTGTIGTGKRVMAACAKTLKKVTLELAGNDAAVVCPDVDLDEVVPKVAGGAFFNAGQLCVATKRVYVHEDIYDSFLERFVAEAEKAEVYGVDSDPTKPLIFGPLSNKTQFDTIKDFIADCKKNNYKIVSGGDIAEPGKGYFVKPTVVAKPPEDSLIVQEEQFGPILPILSWSSEDDVLARANLSNAGLGATVYSRDIARAERIARRLEAGSVYINHPEKPNIGAYFSGFKESGVGGEMGKQGLLSYCNTQCIHYAK